MQAPISHSKSSLEYHSLMYIVVSLNILQPSQSLLRLAHPVIHSHLLEHYFSLFQILQGFPFLVAIRKKLSQEKLAELANLHRTYIGQIENGKRNVALKNATKIAKALGISIKDLF